MLTAAPTPAARQMLMASWSLMEQTAALRAPISSRVLKVTVASPAVPPAPLSAMSARMTGPRGAAMARRTASSGGVGCTIQLSPSATAASVTCLARRAARAGSLSVTTTHEKPAKGRDADDPWVCLQAVHQVDDALHGRVAGGHLRLQGSQEWRALQGHG